MDLDSLPLQSMLTDKHVGYKVDLVHGVLKDVVNDRKARLLIANFWQGQSCHRLLYHYGTQSADAVGLLCSNTLVGAVCSQITKSKSMLRLNTNDCDGGAVVPVSRVRKDNLADLPDLHGVVELFAGAGFWGLPMKACGLQVIGALDSSSEAIATHELNHPGVWARVGKIQDARCWSDIGSEAALLVTAGFVCRDCAQTGRKRGIHGPTGKLNRKVVRFAKTVRPPLLCLECVDSFATRDFGHEKRRLRAAMQQLGYETRDVINNASAFAAGSKARWFLLCVRTDPWLRWFCPLMWPRSLTPWEAGRRWVEAWAQV